MAEVQRIMQGTKWGWPDVNKVEGKYKLLGKFNDACDSGDSRVRVIHVSDRRWEIVIEKLR